MVGVWMAVCEERVCGGGEGGGGAWEMRCESQENAKSWGRNVKEWPKDGISFQTGVQKSGVMYGFIYQPEAGDAPRLRCVLCSNKTTVGTCSKQTLDRPR